METSLEYKYQKLLKTKMVEIKALTESKVQSRVAGIKTGKASVNPQINEKTKTYHCKHIKNLNGWAKFWDKKIQPAKSINLVIFKQEVEPKRESSADRKRVQRQVFQKT